MLLIITGDSMRRLKKAKPHFFLPNPLSRPHWKTQTALLSKTSYNKTQYYKHSPILQKTKHQIGLHEKDIKKVWEPSISYMHWLRRRRNCVNISKIFSISSFYFMNLVVYRTLSLTFNLSTESQTDPCGYLCFHK